MLELIISHMIESSARPDSVGKLPAQEDIGEISCSRTNFIYVFRLDPRYTIGMVFHGTPCVLIGDVNIGQ